MQDLLNEEEFLQPKAYNPWRWFLLFYGVTIIYILFTFLAGALLKEYSRYFELLRIIDFTLPFVMIFAKKQNILLPYKTIIVAITGIYIIFFFIELTQLYLNIDNPLIPKNLFFYAAKGIATSQAILLALTFIFILPIIIYKRRKPVA